MKIIPVIMSGGSGTRLWPISRVNYPKQFAELIEKPLQTLAIERLQKFGKSLIVTTEKLKDLTEKDIIQNHLQVEKVIYEPEGRNTAAAIGIICKYLSMTGRSEDVAGVFPSDSLISKKEEFEAALEAAVSSAEKDCVVTLGILPRGPETGLGYIQVKERALNTQRSTEVLKFHEKPTEEKARAFVADGHYFWNAGIFIFKVKVMIDLFKQYEPEIWNQLDKLSPDLSNIAEVYSHLKSISIDYAILEKLGSNQLRCVPCDIGWSDVGSWDALVEVTESSPFEKDSLKKKPVQLSAKGNAVFSKQQKNYSFIGCDDLIVVDTADALLVCKKSESQKVKDLVDSLKMTDEKITKEHVFENRPWGRFEVLRDESYFKSKIIRVEPGQKISYQSHEKRAEHWVIVRGEAVVTLNDKEHIVKAGENIFIPMRAKHRIHNRTNSLVEFVEVQVGTYFGEDDIKRYQDDYGRK
jgi:mannose-1-phosphate guanylyltransferase/mannose-1-phosphate guanylyltransferase/mannose-6-phosphate isomerase